MNGAFDKFADWTASLVAKAWFFLFCVLLVVIWGPSYFVLPDVDTWQLIINTATTIITFLLVALLHNNQHRFELRVDARLEELTKAVQGAHDPVDE